MLVPGVYVFHREVCSFFMCEKQSVPISPILILLCTDKRLNEQNVKNNTKVMVLKGSEPEGKKAMEEVEERNRLQEESLQRTQKGFQILSERGATINTLLLFMLLFSV